MRCASCGEYAFLPSVATVPLHAFIEMGFIAGALLAFVLESWLLFFGVFMLAAGLGFTIAAVWRLAKVPPRTGAVSLRHPSKFYSGTP